MRRKARFRAIETRSNSGDERRRRQLSEFLQIKLTRRLAVPSLQERRQNQVITEIPYDLLFKILILLPAESLITMQLICKKWFNLINSSDFVTSHAQQSPTVLISKNLTLLEPLLALQLDQDKRAKSYFHFLDLDSGSDNFIESSVAYLVAIKASQDGLVLATVNTSKNLVLMNPVTGKHVLLPLGAFVANPRRECYGIVFCNGARTYKVVHLFCERQGETSCEILSVCTRKWARIEGQPLELRYVGKILVSIGGSLHWVPRLLECDHFITLKVEEEKFATKKLPTCCGFGDRLVEIGESLGFVAQIGDLLFEVWIMGTNWEKRYNISLGGDVRYCLSICGSRNGKEMVLEGPCGSVYAYNLYEDEMRLLHSQGDDDDDGMPFERDDRVYIPHRNTLVSLEGLSCGDVHRLLRRFYKIHVISSFTRCTSMHRKCALLEGWVLNCLRTII